MTYPTLAEDLEVLLGPDHNQLVPLDTSVYDSAADFAKRVAEATPSETNIENLAALRLEMIVRVNSGEIGSLMGERLLNRDRQARTLSKLTVEPILDMMAEGMMLPRIAKRLEVSYGVLSEFVHDQASPERIMRAESLGADMMVDDALEDLETDSLDKEVINRNKALMDAKLKLAKAKSNKWTERKPVGDTYIQNNNGGAPNPNAGEKKVVRGFQLVMREGELPPLKPLNKPPPRLPKALEEDMLIPNGEFTLVPGK